MHDLWHPHTFPTLLQTSEDCQHIEEQLSVLFLSTNPAYPEEVVVDPQIRVLSFSA